MPDTAQWGPWSPICSTRQRGARCPDFAFDDITYHRAVDQGTVRIAFNRPEVRNAFRPHTVDELYRALDHARMTPDVGCVLLTGNGPSPKDGGWAFCSGGDQRIRGRDGYKYAADQGRESIEPGRAGRLHILEVQRLIRFMPKIVICVVPGWAAGGGHSLHVVCDLTLASAEHARFKQTDADVASFDGGFGSAYLARQVGQKFAREIFFLGEYSAADAHRMGMVNAVVPHAELESTALQWASEINGKSPTAQRMLKFSFNLIDDGLVGQQVFAGEATRLAYMTDEAEEGRSSFLEKRDPTGAPSPGTTDVILIDDADDPRLACFRRNERGLASRRQRRSDDGDGLFMAEGDLVVERALDAGCRPVVALVDAAKPPQVANRFPDDVPIYAGGDRVRAMVTQLGVPQRASSLSVRPASAPHGRATRTAGDATCRGRSGRQPDQRRLDRSQRNCSRLGRNDLRLHQCRPAVASITARFDGHAIGFPAARCTQLPGELRLLAHDGFAVCALTPSAEAEDIGTIPITERMAIVIGSERSGLSAEALAATTHRVRIPMASGIDSLNAAAASAVACYALGKRQPLAVTGHSARSAEAGDEIGNPVSLRICSAAGTK